MRRVGRTRSLAILALCGAAVAGMAGDTLAQDSDHQIRCMQLQQELASASGGGGREALPGIDKQIQNASRVYNGTKAAMEDSGCFERGFLIFGRGLVRSPKCLKMNDQVEDARRQVEQLQAQRDGIAGGRGNRRRQAELMDALARNGCSGGRPMQQQARRESGGGLFGWFGRGGSDEEEAAQPEGPVYRSIDPNGRYRSVCVRTCDGFFFPVSYQTYASHLSQDASVCQSSCAAPAELYVYRNPGQEIDQAISLNGTAYSDLPAAFKYRKEYVTGCSCKANEYNPTAIEGGEPKGRSRACARQARQEGIGPGTDDTGRRTCRTASWTARPDRRPAGPAASRGSGGSRSGTCRRGGSGPCRRGGSGSCRGGGSGCRRGVRTRGTTANERGQAHACLWSLIDLKRGN